MATSRGYVVRLGDDDDDDDGDDDDDDNDNDGDGDVACEGFSSEQIHASFNLSVYVKGKGAP
jgi:hypothetical protein